MCSVVAVLGPLLVLGLQLWPYASETLRFTRLTYAHGAPWQLLTSQLVHLNWLHAWGNALALGVTLLGWNAWVRLHDQGLALGGGMLGVALVLALDPQCTYYAGLSGALYGLWAGNAVTLLGNSKRPVHQTPFKAGGHALAWQRLGAIGIVLVLLIRLWWQGRGGPDTSTTWLQAPIYRPAHIAGLAGGGVLMGLMLLWRTTAPGRAP